MAVTTEEIYMRKEALKDMRNMNSYLLVKNPDLYVAGYVSKIEYGVKFTLDDIYEGFVNIGGKPSKSTRSKIEKTLSNMLGNWDLRLTADGGYIRISD